MSSLVLPWLGLLALTAVSLIMGNRFGHAPWMPLLVALIIWIKGTLVARYFIESHQAHPFIAVMLRIFIAFAPAALVLTAFFGK
ncbi:hypothetical protein [Herminiimonas sp. CN]|uniref:hypothetical protein n=1 Tax=Herminiimonas sp. CN TaxID=1349818 RepID=UPI001930DCA7|nr:hypothetical protein [Herminiimonas sp. CN]